MLSSPSNNPLPTKEKKDCKRKITAAPVIDKKNSSIDKIVMESPPEKISKKDSHKFESTGLNLMNNNSFNSNYNTVKKPSGNYMEDSSRDDIQLPLEHPNFKNSAIDSIESEINKNHVKKDSIFDVYHGILEVVSNNDTIDSEEIKKRIKNKRNSLFL